MFYAAAAVAYLAVACCHAFTHPAGTSFTEGNTSRNSSLCAVGVIQALAKLTQGR